MKVSRPTRESASKPWTAVLPDYIPRMEGASSLRAYYEELERLTALLNDGHVRIVHPVLASRAPVPLMTSTSCGQGRGFAGRTAPGRNPSRDIRVGDEVLAIDGVPVVEIEQQAVARISSGRPEERWLTGHLPAPGPAGTTVNFRVRNAAGRNSEHPPGWHICGLRLYASLKYQRESPMRTPTACNRVGATQTYKRMQLPAVLSSTGDVLTGLIFRICFWFSAQHSIAIQDWPDRPGTSPMHIPGGRGSFRRRSPRPAQRS